jgi:Flp pilus assembly protein protease CpaA
VTYTSAENVMLNWPLALPVGPAGVMVGPISLAAVVILVVMVTATITDLRERRVPIWLTLGGVTLGLIVAGIHGSEALVASLIGMVVGLLLLSPFVPFGGIGLGDVFLLGVVGAWLGWHFVFWTVWWGAMAGAALSLITIARLQPTLSLPALALRARWKASRRATLPYVPALALGAVGALLSQSG